MRLSYLVLVVIVLAALVVSQRTSFRDYQYWRLTRCDNATAGDNTCYKNLTVLYPGYTVFEYEPNYIIAAFEDPDINYRDFCDNSITRDLYEANMTCIDFFCPSNDTMAAKSVVTTALTYHYLKLNGTSGYTRFVENPDMFFLADYGFFRNHCFYCNHPTRDAFRARLEQNTCPYFWQHEKGFCGEGENTVTTVGSNPGDASDRSIVYLRKVRNNQPEFAQYSVRNFSNFLSLTAYRTARKDHIGESARGEYYYTCYCTNIGRVGKYCDGYVSFFLPFKFLALPYIAIFWRFFFFLVVLWVVLIPYIWRDVSKYLQRGNVQAKKFFIEFFGDLKVQTALLMSAAILIGILEEPTILTLADPTSGYPYINGLFRTLSYFLTGLSLGSILILWSHIYSATQSMTMAGGLDIKHKVGLALFYLVFISVLVVAIAGIIVIAIVGRFFPAISTPARSILFATLLLIAIVFMFFFALGFFVYGIMMFRTIKQVDQDVQVWDKKFMKFMIITDLLFMLFCIWLFIVTLNSWLLPNAMGEFMTLFSVYILDFCVFLMFSMVTFLLYDPKVYWEVIPYKFMCGKCRNISCKKRASEATNI